MSISTILRSSFLVIGLVGGAACNPPWTLDGSSVVALTPQADGGVLACKLFDFRRRKVYDGGFDTMPVYESWLVDADGRSERFVALDCPERAPSRGPFALAGGGQVRVDITQGSPAAAILVEDARGVEVWRYETGEYGAFIGEPSGEHVFAGVRRDILKLRLSDGTADWSLTPGRTPNSEP